MARTSRKKPAVEDVSAYYKRWSELMDFCWTLALQPHDTEHREENIRAMGMAIAYENRERDRMLERMLRTRPSRKRRE